MRGFSVGISVVSAVAALVAGGAFAAVPDDLFRGGRGDGYSAGEALDTRRLAVASWYRGGAGDGADGRDAAGLASPLTWDSDADALPNWWELQEYGGVTNAVAGADEDADGADTRNEFGADTDPRSAASVFRLLRMTASNQEVVLAFSSSTQRVYTLQGATDLVVTNWAAVPGVNSVTGAPSGETVFSTSIAAPDTRFFRIQAAVP